MKTIDKTSFIDCDSQSENTATYDFNTLSYKQGKATLSPKQINRIGFILATDLKAFFETNGNSFQPYPQMQFILIYRTINKTQKRGHILSF